MELPYKRHLAGHALNACHKCGERLSSRKALVKHLRHEHKLKECEKWFSCDKCPKRFMKKRSWLIHTKVSGGTPAEGVVGLFWGVLCWFDV